MNEASMLEIESKKLICMPGKPRTRAVQSLLKRPQKRCIVAFMRAVSERRSMHELRDGRLGWKIKNCLSFIDFLDRITTRYSSSSTAEFPVGIIRGRV